MVQDTSLSTSCFSAARHPVRHSSGLDTFIILGHYYTVHYFPKCNTNVITITHINHISLSEMSLGERGTVRANKMQAAPLEGGGAVFHRSDCLCVHNVSYPCLPNIQAVSHLPISHEAGAVKIQFLGRYFLDFDKRRAQIFKTNFLFTGSYYCYSIFVVVLATSLNSQRQFLAFLANLTQCRTKPWIRWTSCVGLLRTDVRMTVNEKTKAHNRRHDLRSV